MASGVYASGRDADLGAHTEFAAVRILRRCVVHDDRAVEFVQEALCGLGIRRNDRVRVSGTETANIVQRVVQSIHDADCHDRVQELVAPIGLGCGHDAFVGSLSPRIAADFAAGVD